MKKTLLLVAIAFNVAIVTATATPPSPKTYIAQSQNAEDTYYQELKVTWTAENTIQYSFTLRTNGCNETYRGTATNTTPGDNDPKEIIKRITKKPFNVDRYHNSSKSHRLFIKIDVENQSKAVVEFDTISETEEESSCRSHYVVMQQR